MIVPQQPASLVMPGARLSRDGICYRLPRFDICAPPTAMTNQCQDHLIGRWVERQRFAYKIGQCGWRGAVFVGDPEIVVID